MLDSDIKEQCENIHEMKRHFDEQTILIENIEKQLEKCRKDFEEYRKDFKVKLKKCLSLLDNELKKGTR